MCVCVRVHICMCVQVESTASPFCVFVRVQMGRCARLTLRLGTALSEWAVGVTQPQERGVEKWGWKVTETDSHVLTKEKQQDAEWRS